MALLRRLTRMNLSQAILLALVLGIFTGLFLGELAAPLSTIGNAFIRLLQMTILPYIVVSLIAGIGSLTLTKARLLATKAGVILILTWVLAFLFIFTIPLSFPTWESASFFSQSLVEVPEAPDFLQLYIPANPFASLAENLVPAVVLFSISIGVALIGVRAKESFLGDLQVLAHALMRVTGFVVRLTPIGVFAIAASAAGTLTLEELSKLQVYLIAFTVACLLLAFWVLPVLVAITTPFTYKETLRVSRDALVTAFTTGNLFVVLPLLTENAKELFHGQDATDPDTDNYVDVIIPVSFNFPNIGKLIMLMFVLFAGWFAGRPMDLAQYPQFIVSGLLSFFGGVDVALPFMLDQMHIPSDMYQLYMVTGIVNGRTSTLLAAMNLLVFTLLATAAVTGRLHIHWGRLLRLLLITLGILAVSIGAMRAYFQLAVDNAYTKDKVVANMQLLQHDSPADTFEEPPGDAVPRRDPARPLLEQIRGERVLRVGYLPGHVPFSYRNAQGQLVGLDIDLMHLLAQELKVRLEFYPFSWPHILDDLGTGRYDLLVSGLPLTTDLLSQVTFTQPYMDVTLAFLTPDFKRHLFEDLTVLKDNERLRIGVLKSADDFFLERLERLLPKARILEIDDLKDFLHTNAERLDAVMVSAEAGSAISLLHPEFSAVVPKPLVVKHPLALAVAHQDQGLKNFLDQWLRIQRDSRTFERLYDYWVLGKGAEKKAPHWSIIRDVLHWVD